MVFRDRCIQTTHVYLVSLTATIKWSGSLGQLFDKYKFIFNDIDIVMRGVWGETHNFCFC